MQEPLDCQEVRVPADAHEESDIRWQMAIFEETEDRRRFITSRADDMTEAIEERLEVRLAALDITEALADAAAEAGAERGDFFGGPTVSLFGATPGSLSSSISALELRTLELRAESCSGGSSPEARSLMKLGSLELAAELPLLLTRPKTAPSVNPLRRRIAGFFSV